MKVIYFDLDGPLLDVSEKYYRVYCDIISQNGFLPVSKFIYWELKRNKTPEKTILDLSGAERIADLYSVKRKRCIEEDQYLNLDTLQDSALDVLGQLKKENYNIVLVTLRSSIIQLEKQLYRLGMHDYFSEIMSSGEETIPRWKIKYNLIAGKGNGHPFSQRFFVGDTETDIIAANELGLHSVGVLNGIRNYQQIKNASPKHIITGIHEFIKLIN